MIVLNKKLIACIFLIGGLVTASLFYFKVKDDQQSNETKSQKSKPVKKSTSDDEWYKKAITPKPDGVSLEEYEAKNLAGYCWRDKKYYTTEDLFKRRALARVKFNIQIYERFFLNQVPSQHVNGGYLPETDLDCKRRSACRIYISNNGLSNEEIKAHALDKNNKWGLTDVFNNQNTTLIFSKEHAFDEKHFLESFNSHIVLIDDFIDFTSFEGVGSNPVYDLKDKNNSILKESVIQYFARDKTKLPSYQELQKKGIGVYLVKSERLSLERNSSVTGWDKNSRISTAYQSADIKSGNSYNLISNCGDSLIDIPSDLFNTESEGVK